MKFIIHDEDGRETTVEEVIEEETRDEDMDADKLAELTSDEISALKRLAAVADKLMTLIDSDKETEETEEIEETVETEDEDVTEEEVEEVIDTAKTRDSKHSFGSLERKRKTNDSLEEDSISYAWQQRYNK